MNKVIINKNNNQLKIIDKSEILEALDVKENKINKVTSLSSSTDLQYPSAKCVYDNLLLKEDSIEVISNQNEVTSDGMYLIDLPIIASIITSDNEYHKVVLRFTDISYRDNQRIFIDWGDGNICDVSGGVCEHIYDDGIINHKIIIKGNISYYRQYMFGVGVDKVIIKQLSSIEWVNSIFASDNTTYISEVTLPQGIVILPIGAFQNQKELISLQIPSSITTIKNYCFQNCSKLEEINIPGNVTSIGNLCFDGCTSLIKYKLYWEDDESILTYDDVGYTVNTNTIFIIPHGTKQLYIDKNYPSNKLVEREE